MTIMVSKFVICDYLNDELIIEIFVEKQLTTENPQSFFSFLS